MKNLKRALSLALSSIMLMGMMVVGTGAKGYDDVTSAHNVEAIEVLEAMGVMEGTGDGFNPDAKVTRQEMAVIMCNVLDLTVSSYKGTTSFTDVDSWALPYVEACYTNGIITGYDATTFGAKDNLTTGQAALMLMKALGYFQETGDFGQDWLVATTKQGAIIDLFAGVKTGAKEALTRNDVAKLVLNALKSDMVKIDSYDVVADGKGGFTTKANYDARDRKAGIDFNGTAADINELQLVEELYGNTFKVSGTSDDFGRPSTEWTKNLDTIGVYPSTPVATFNNGVSKDALYNTLGSSLVGKLDDGDGDAYELRVYVDGRKQYTVSGDTEVRQATKNGDANMYILAEDIGLYAAKGLKSTNVPGTDTGVETEVYVTNENKTVTIVIIPTYVVVAASDYSKVTKSVMLDDYSKAYKVYSDMVVGGMKLSSESWEVEDVVEGDFLLINRAYNSAKGKYFIADVFKANTMSGVVESYDQKWDNNNAGKTVTVDGTPYKYSAKAGDETKYDFAIGETATFVMDKFNNVIAVADSVVGGNLAYVLDCDSTTTLKGSTYDALLIFTDGSSAAVRVNKVDGKKISSTSVEGKWVFYTKHTDGSYSLNTKIQDSYKQFMGGNTYNNGDVLVNGEKVAAYSFTSTYYNNKDSVLIVLGAQYEDVFVYNGVGSMPYINAKDTIDAGFTYVAEKDSSYVSYMIVDLGACADDKDYDIIDNTTKPEFVFVLDKVAETNKADGVVYYTYNTLNADGSISKTVFEAPEAEDLNYTLVYKTHVNKEGRVTKMDVVTESGRYFYSGANDTTVTYSGNTLRMAGNYIVTSDSKVTVIIHNDGDNAKRAYDIMEDASATYEVYANVDAKFLPNLLKQADCNAFSGTVSGVLVENGTEIVETMYIYVNDINKI